MYSLSDERQKTWELHAGSLCEDQRKPHGKAGCAVHGPKGAACARLQIGEVGGPGGRLVLADGRNDGDVLAGVGGVQQAQAAPCIHQIRLLRVT